MGDCFVFSSVLWGQKSHTQLKGMVYLTLFQYLEDSSCFLMKKMVFSTCDHLALALYFLLVNPWSARVKAEAGRMFWRFGFPSIMSQSLEQGCGNVLCWKFSQGPLYSSLWLVHLPFPGAKQQAHLPLDIQGLMTKRSSLRSAHLVSASNCSDIRSFR